MTPEEYCQNKAAKSGSSFYYSFLFLPPEQRMAITALYAFCREVDDVVDECNEPEIAINKLAWWRNEINNLFNGQPQHPVTQALKPHIQTFNLPQEYFQEIIDGMEMDLTKSSYSTFKDLSLYCYRVASVVGLLSVEIFGYEDRNTIKYAHNLGMAFQLTNILRDIREDMMRGRVYMPEDDMNTFGVNIHDLKNPATNKQLQDLLRFQIERARGYYQKAFEYLPDSDRYKQRCGIIMAEIYLKLLDEIENDGCRVLEHRIRLTPVRKLWIAWKTARREKRYNKKKQQTIHAQ
ncbi:MAG: presqualene diphosphate synthase HpnD [Gammaproteobacteria bacterium]|nr:presqualene diphosphate synthase HpnD [Gammaproteobacteria bacterium]